MTATINTKTRLHIETERGTVVAVCGNELLPTRSPSDSVAFISAEGDWLSLEDCERLGRFLLDAANQAYDAKRRAHQLADPALQNAPNMCKSCGYLNDPHKRGWCGCEHCGGLMDRGPFLGETMEEHKAKGPKATGKTT
jgi:hypothetical protein